MTRTIAHAVVPAADRPRLGLSQRAGRRLVLAALARCAHGRIEVVDGEHRHAGGDLASDRRAVVRVHDPRFYTALALEGGSGAGEAYFRGWFTTDDLPLLIELLTVNMTALRSLEGPLSALTEPARRLGYLLRRNTREGSRRNIVAHYDLSNEFFALFLDPSMTYSCAIYDDPSWSLERAQREKIDRACRKLDLRPTDHLLEIGTGWGAMAVHAASVYGCRVTTTTISERQHEVASARVREAGLEGRVEVVRRDYRDLRGSYDKLVSIEMIEAVGREYLPGFFRACSSLLKPDGQMLLQAIVIRDQFFRGASRRADFLKRWIFPGSCLPSVERMLGCVRGATDLRLWHMEDIGPHYVRTLATWRAALLARGGEARAMGLSEEFLRLWEFYFAYCEGAFRARHVGDVQMLFTKPMVRREPYAERGPGTRAP